LARRIAGLVGPDLKRDYIMSAKPVYFAIPLSAKVNDQQWVRLNELLGLTLDSLANQSDQNLRAFICGHHVPDVLGGARYPFVEFIKADFPVPTTDNLKRKDKRHKRWEIARRVRGLGGGYFMYLDGDDLVHRDLVKFIRQDDNKVGYLITDGYALDFTNKVIAPIPGAFSKRFNEVCGSSGIVYLLESDLPNNDYREAAGDTLYGRIGNHTHFEKLPMRDGKMLSPVPFPAAVYTLNNSLNLSNILVRTGDRQLALINSIKNHSVVSAEQVAPAFGLSSFFEGASGPDTVASHLFRSEGMTGMDDPGKPKRQSKEELLEILRPRARQMVALQEYARKVGWIRSARTGRPVDRRGQALPWYTYAAISFLTPRLKSSFRVFEYGSGNSTLWWARQVDFVRSVEHQAGWAEILRPLLPPNVDYLHIDLEEGGDYSQSSSKEGGFHIVVVDGRDRINCAINAVHALTDDGVIIWDNTERRRYSEGIDALMNIGFRRLSFRGLAPIRAKELETSIFYRGHNCLGI